MIPKITTGVGAGFSLNGLTCGCISGAAMVIGMRYGRRSSSESPQPTWKKVDRFIAEFKDRWGAITCSELTRLDVKTADGMSEYLRNVHDYACTERVKFTTARVVDTLKSESHLWNLRIMFHNFFHAPSLSKGNVEGGCFYRKAYM